MTVQDDTQVRNAIVIGSGPSGYTAAIYLARAALEPLVFEGSVTAGGALMNTTDVENYPGFPDGVMGPQLMDDLRRQAERFGAELVTDDVTEVDLHADPKVVKVGAATYYAKTVVLAMGSAYRVLDVPGESELSGRGVSWCATCDGFFFRDQDIVVVGGGDTAVEEATFLTRFARSVTMVHRRDALRASKVMQERAFANDKIRFEWDSEVLEAVGDEQARGGPPPQPGDGRGEDPGGHGPVHRGRPRPALRARQGPGRPRRRRLRAQAARPLHRHERPRRVRRRRPRRPHLPAGDHGGRVPAAPPPWTPSASWPPPRTPRRSRTSASTPACRPTRRTAPTSTAGPAVSRPSRNTRPTRPVDTYVRPDLES